MNIKWILKSFTEDFPLKSNARFQNNKYEFIATPHFF